MRACGIAVIVLWVVSVVLSAVYTWWLRAGPNFATRHMPTYVDMEGGGMMIHGMQLVPLTNEEREERIIMWDKELAFLTFAIASFNIGIVITAVIRDEIVKV